MSKTFLKVALGWGFVLWLIGYVLGIVLFALVPVNLIGWVIAPIGTVITLWVAFEKIKGENFNFYLLVAVVWTAIAVAFDYLFIVKALKPADGYYKLDVYFYYFLTFIIPLIAGYFKAGKPSDTASPGTK